jgi:threonine synthase
LIPVIDRVPEPVEDEGVWRWSKGFLEQDLSYKISLKEGSTPLLRSKSINKKYRIKNLFFKDESRNPNNLFIDRGSAYLISLIKNRGFRSVNIISRGDHAISLATYARRANLKSFAILPADTLPYKIYRTMLVASKVKLVEDFEHALNIMRYYSKISPERIYISPADPYLMNGYQTILFEILYELEKPPDAIILPVGDGALMISLAILAKKLDLKTMFIGVRSKGESPLLSEIRSEKPLLKEYLDELLRQTDHEIIEVSDEMILESIREMSREEALPIDPVNASVIAALHSEHVEGLDDVIVLFTGGGLLHDPAVMKIVLKEEKTDKIGLGFVKEKILEILLEEGGAPVYRVWRILETTYGVKISLRTVYNHIKDLVNKGLIEPVLSDEETPGRPRRIYMVTDKIFYYLMR